MNTIVKELNEKHIQQKRDILLELLNQCTPEQQNIFKRMYSHKDLQKSNEEIVAQLPVEKLDWAITQCEMTLRKNKTKQQ